MTRVNVTELRQNLHEYLELVQSGEEISISSRGRPIARLVPAIEVKEELSQKLRRLREGAVIGDVISPIDETWAADDVGP